MVAKRRKPRLERSAPTGLDAVDIDLPNFVPYVVSLLMHRLHGVMARALAPLEMNIAEWRVTVCLSRHEKCTLNEVVEFTGLVQPSKRGWNFKVPYCWRVNHVPGYIEQHP